MTGIESVIKVAGVDSEYYNIIEGKRTLDRPTIFTAKKMPAEDIIREVSTSCKQRIAAFDEFAALNHALGEFDYLTCVFDLKADAGSGISPTGISMPPPYTCIRYDHDYLIVLPKSTTGNKVAQHFAQWHQLNNKYWEFARDNRLTHNGWWKQPEKDGRGKYDSTMQIFLQWILQSNESDVKSHFQAFPALKDETNHQRVSRVIDTAVNYRTFLQESYESLRRLTTELEELNTK